MELNAISQLRRTAVRTQEKKTDVPASASSDTRPRTDSIALTEQAVAVLKDQSRRLTDLLRQEPEDPPELWGLAETGEEPGSDMLDALGEKLKAMLRCQKIAARIMRGDKVPPQDERYLMENDPNGYKMAMAMRTPKKKPKEWDSVLEDEEQKTEGDGGGEETSQVSEAASGGDAPASGEE